MAAKRFEFAASLERDGGILAEGGTPLEQPDPWLPEHLVLVAVAQCLLASLRFYAPGATVSGRADCAGTVARRDEDGLYAFVEVEILLDVEIDPAPTVEQLPKLLDLASRGCFVGNSLTTKPRSVWRVNGQPVEAGP